MNAIMSDPKTLPCFTCGGRGVAWASAEMPPTEGIEDYIAQCTFVPSAFPETDADIRKTAYRLFHQKKATPYFLANTEECKVCEGTGETEFPELKR